MSLSLFCNIVPKVQLSNGDKCFVMPNYKNVVHFAFTYILTEMTIWQV